MEIILKENLANLGKMGEVVRVADGYARNFLLPRKLAVAATPGNKKIAAAQGKAIEARQAGLKSEAETLKSSLEAVALKFEREAGEDDLKLFGSVTTKDIFEKLIELGLVNQARSAVEGEAPRALPVEGATRAPIIDKRKIILGQPLKTLGKHTVQVWLHPEVSATLSVEVVKR